MRQLTIFDYENYLKAEAKYRLTDEEKLLVKEYSYARLPSRADRPTCIERKASVLHKQAYNKNREYRRYSTFERYVAELDRQAKRQRKANQKRTDWIRPIAIEAEKDPVRAYWMKRLKTIQTRTYNCTLTVDDLMELHRKQPNCPALGTPLLLDGNTHVDQIKPGEGYHVGNVQLLSSIANRIKTNATPEQVMAVAEYLMRQ